MAGAKSKRRAIDGILIFDKPLGMSSNAALQKVRWLFNAAKGGHTGSLDPLATGVLPLCLGEATKFSQYLLDADKAYITEARLGMTTATGDAEGDVLEMKPVNVTLADVEARCRALPARLIRCRRCTRRSSTKVNRYTSWPALAKPLSARRAPSPSAI